MVILRMFAVRAHVFQFVGVNHVLKGVGLKSGDFVAGIPPSRASARLCVSCAIVAGAT